MARLNTSSFPSYCGSCSAERAVASVLQSVAVKKVVKYKSRESLAAILNLRKACVLFIMAKRHPVKNSQLMKVIRDVHSFKEKASK
jgi:hypothetical protein